MKRFQDTYIEKLPEPIETGNGHGSVRVAIVDTGFSIKDVDRYDERGDPMWDIFLDHPDVGSRVKEKRNFFSADAAEPDPDDYEDRYGHGTQVARLVLRFAPRATVIIAKISDSKTLNATKMAQLVKVRNSTFAKIDIAGL